MCLLGNFFLSLVVESSHWSFIFVQINFLLENLREVSYESKAAHTFSPCLLSGSPFVVVGLIFLVGGGLCIVCQGFKFIVRGEATLILAEQHKASRVIK